MRVGPVVAVPGTRQVASGGAAPFVPSDIAGLKFWIDAQFSADITLNTTPDPDTVSAFADHSASSNDVSQATGSAQPQYLPTGFTGDLPCMKFINASASRLFQSASPLATTLSNNAAYTVFLVLQRDGATTNQYPFTLSSAGSANPVIRIVTPGNSITLEDRDDAGSQSTVPSGAISATGTYLVAIVRPTSIASAKIWVDGIDITGSITAGADGTKTLTRHAVGGPNISGTAGTWNEKIAAVLVYDTALSNANRQLVETYLQARWETSALP